MIFDPQVVLNEELPTKKYESYSGGDGSVNTDTLDEPVLDTVVMNRPYRSETFKKSMIR